MKKIKSIILILSMMFAVSCMDMYNDVADEVGVEYNYFLVSTVEYVGDLYTRIFSLDSGGIPEFGNLKETINVTGATASSYPAVHPNGKYLYIPDSTNNLLLVYIISDDGTLVLFQSIATGTAPSNVKVHPSGNYVYVTNKNLTGSISVYNVTKNGTLTNNSVLSAGNSPRRILIHPSGKNLFVIEGTGAGSLIKVCSINSDGSLTHLEYETAVTTNLTDFVIHPNGRYIYVTRDGGFDKCNINNDGTIDGASKYSSNTIGNSGYLAINSTGDYIFTASFSDVSSYKITGNGEVSQINQVSFGSGQTYDLLIHPSGNVIYVSDSGNDHIYYYLVDDNGTIYLSSVSKNIYTYGLALIRKKQ